jgi:hypothetical protein
MTILFLCAEADLVKERAGYARAFRRRGIRVACVHPGEPLNVKLDRLLACCPERPSLILHVESPLMPRGLAKVPIPTALMQSDPYAYTHRRLRWAMLFDHVLLLHDGFEDRFRAAGHPAPITLLHAVDPKYFDGAEEERTFQISSVGRVDGSNYQTRREVLGALAEKFRMNEWSREHTYEELADVYRKTRIVVNIGRDDYPTDVSLRFAEAMAAGALFITQLPSELENLEFVEGVHYVGFRDRAEISSLVRRYLSDESSRWRIAQAGREKVLQEHTYDCRVEVLLVRLTQAEGKFFAPARQWSESRVRLAYLDFFAAHQVPDCASAELRAIARLSLGDATRGAGMLARAWARKSRARMTGAIRSVWQSRNSGATV